MIKNFNKPSRKDDIKLLSWIIAGFIFVAWLCTPPGNKFLQMCFWGNHVKYFTAKLMRPTEVNDYIFYRNNAIYLAKMYKKNPERAVAEMNKAISSVPAYISDEELNSLYKERAQIKLFAGDFSGALDDFLHSGKISFMDNLTVAMLLKERGRYKLAGSYCNEILNADSTAYAGYACLSELYVSLGRHDVAQRIWDLAIDRKKNNPRAYMDRAKVKKLSGDIKGYEADVAKAKEYLPTIKEEDSIIYDALHPKILTLQIRPL